MVDLSRPLLDWYEQNKRDLPWRRDVTPYRVWVSEIMLQQTRIEAARGYFERFMRALPTVEDLADAEEDTVLKLWEGLGYYSRARNLHKCARVIARERGGEFPRTVAELRALPGIGAYTAGAVASLAFNAPEAAVDGNVCRVLARVEACSETVGAPMRARYRRELTEILPEGKSGRCPVAALCRARAEGDPDRYPVLPEKKTRRIEERRVLLMICADRVALRRRPERGLLSGLWELPNDTVPEPPEHGEPCGEAVHRFSHVEWRMRGYVLRVAGETEGFRWVTPEERRALAIPAAFSFYLKKLEEMGL